MKIMKNNLQKKVPSFLGIQVIIIILVIIFSFLSYKITSLTIILDLLLVISFALISYLSFKQNPKKITYLYYFVTFFCIIRFIMDVIQYG